ncbi:MAG: PepSY domain-containing protein [Bacteroidota bacterium]
MKKIQVLFFAVLFSFMNTSCGLFDDDNSNDNIEENNNGNAPQSLTDKALAIFSGTVVYTDTYSDEGRQLVEIVVRNEEGARVEFYFVQNTGEIYEIEGLSGPFNYDLQADTSWISLIQAITLGCTAANSSDCNITEWELYNNTAQPYYEIYFENRVEVDVNAITGDIISIDTDD